MTPRSVTAFPQGRREGPHLADQSLSHQNQCSLTVVHRIPKRCTPLPVPRPPPDEPTMADAFEMDLGACYAFSRSPDLVERSLYGIRIDLEGSNARRRHPSE